MKDGSRVTSIHLNPNSRDYKILSKLIFDSLKESKPALGRKISNIFHGRLQLIIDKIYIPLESSDFSDSNLLWHIDRAWNTPKLFIPINFRLLKKSSFQIDVNNFNFYQSIIEYLRESFSYDWHNNLANPSPLNKHSSINLRMTNPNYLIKEFNFCPKKGEMLLANTRNYHRRNRFKAGDFRIQLNGIFYLDKIHVKKILLLLIFIVKSILKICSFLNLNNFNILRFLSSNKPIKSKSIGDYKY